MGGYPSIGIETTVSVLIMEVYIRVLNTNYMSFDSSPLVEYESTKIRKI